MDNYIYTTTLLKKAHDEMIEDNKDYTRNISDLESAISKHEVTIDAAKNNILATRAEIGRLQGKIENNKWNMSELINVLHSLEGE